jgi:hypothetical protein
MGHSSFSLLKNGIGYIRVLGKMVWQSRFGLRLLPGKASPETADDIPIAVATTEDPSCK